MSKPSMLTTTDNPFNPFEDFASWLQFDMEKGYNSCSYLARIANVRSDMSDKEYEAEYERAIDEIVRINPLCKYTKVVRDHASTQDNGV